MLSEKAIREAISDRKFALRFWSKVAVDGADKCWEWLAGRRADGYGVITYRSIAFGSHRAAWSLRHRRTPGKRLVMHKCDNPICVNPSHLCVGTHLDNYRDSERKGRRVNVGGERNGNSRLAEADVRRIRLLSTSQSMKSIARVYGVAASTIERIVHRRRWRHVK